MLFVCRVVFVIMLISSLAKYTMAYRVQTVSSSPIFLSLSFCQRPCHAGVDGDGADVRQPQSKRLFHVLTSLITTFAAISYYAMANGDGVVSLVVKVWEATNGKLPSTYHYVHRELDWARYVGWSKLPSYPQSLHPPKHVLTVA